MSGPRNETVVGSKKGCNFMAIDISVVISTYWSILETRAPLN